MGYDIVELSVAENENNFSMELWGSSPDIFSIDILTPSGEYVPRIDARLDETFEFSFIFESTRIVVIIKWWNPKVRSINLGSFYRSSSRNLAVSCLWSRELIHGI